MFVKSLMDCDQFIANDGCRIQELLHPANDAIELPYSLAIAQVAVGSNSYRHKLAQSEVYFILQGNGLMHVDDETRLLKQGDAVVIPAEAEQWIENHGKEELVFAAIVSPPWNEEDDIRL